MKRSPRGPHRMAAPVCFVLSHIEVISLALIMTHLRQQRRQGHLQQLLYRVVVMV